MKNNLLLQILFFTLLPISTLHAQNFSLKQCLDYAVKNNIQLKKATSDVQKNDFFLKEQYAISLPQVEANAQILMNPALPQQQLPGEIFGMPGTTVPVKFGTKYNPSANVQASQLLYSKSYKAGIQAVKTYGELAKLGAEKARQQVINAIPELYFQTQIIGKQQQILNANLKQINDLKRITQVQVENGITKKIDLDRLTVSATNIETQLKNLDLAHQQQLQVLKLYMAMPANAQLILIDTINEQNYKIYDDVKKWKPMDYAQKIDYKLIEKQQQLNQIGINKIKAEYYPTVSAFVQGGVQAQAQKIEKLFNINDTWSYFFAVGVKANMPIFDGFRKKYQIEQAKIDIEKNKQDTEILKQQLDFEYTIAIQKLESNLNSLQIQDQNRQLSQQVYRVTQNRFKEGVAPIYEVLTSENEMSQAQSNYLIALLNVKLAEIDLQKFNNEFLEMVK